MVSRAHSKNDHVHVEEHEDIHVLWRNSVIRRKPLESLGDMINHARWYFNVTKWTPTKEEWMRLTSSIAHDELERINKFVYQDNAKDALIGRALIRKFLSNAASIPSDEPTLVRTRHGRPEVSDHYRRIKGKSWPVLLDFNVSHSGDYCVLAGVWSVSCPPCDVRVGVDVTKIVSKKTKPELDRFLDLMSRRPFTKNEWATVEKPTCDRQKCINFTRLWCLKESYIKSTGLGLTFKLDRIDFKFSDEHKYNLSTTELKGRLLGDTCVMLDGQPAPDWRFFETALDDEHIVALGYNMIGSSSGEVDLSDGPFKEVGIDSIVESLRPMRTVNEQDWKHFATRPRKAN